MQTSPGMDAAIAGSASQGLPRRKLLRSPLPPGALDLSGHLRRMGSRDLLKGLGLLLALLLPGGSLILLGMATWRGLQAARSGVSGER